MICPKCSMTAVLKDEDFVQLVEEKMIVKQSFECGQCGFIFSRINNKEQSETVVEAVTESNESAKTDEPVQLEFF